MTKYEMSMEIMEKDLKSQGYVIFTKGNKYVLTEKGIDTVKKAKDIS